jgi:uncharacterized protein
MTDGASANHLQGEKSPYLIQHVNNPVNWYPWGEEAFNLARERDLPIFLSIGYSTCHWCHVMAEESFEDPKVAELLNSGFVPIKVDREERPDIDHFYMAVCQAVTGSGGWPLTIIMTPDREPFFAGTYIPKMARYGMIGMMDLLPKVEEMWTSGRERVLNSAKEIIAHLQKTGTGKEHDWPESSESGPGGYGKGRMEKSLGTTYRSLAKTFDSINGGFGDAPKFPTPHNLLFLLRYWKRTNENMALEMVERTLRTMRAGGMYDQIGHGFHRYSTDAQWLVPHFEKMLYDQALLIMAYAEAYQVTNKQEYRNTVENVHEYVIRELTSREGGFFSAEDADSEGSEGKFYLWTLNQLKTAVEPHEAELGANILSFEEEGNFTDPHRPGGHNDSIPHLSPSTRDLLWNEDITARELGRSLEAIRKKLFEVREARIRPHKDDKILTDWNGLMIAALARASRIIGDERYLETARRAESFIMNNLRDKDGNLLHRYRDGDASIPGNLDDHAFMILGLVELYQATFEAEYLSKALELAKLMTYHFLDPGSGGFFFTSDSAHELPVRRKEYYDGAIPSGNSFAALGLILLGRITGDTNWEDLASTIIHSASSEISHHPQGFVNMMNALDLGIGPSKEIVIVGDPESKDTNELLNIARSTYLPGAVVILKPFIDTTLEPAPDPHPRDISILAPYLSNYSMIGDRATAYVCEGYACQRPTNDPEELRKLLAPHED